MSLKSEIQNIISDTLKEKLEISATPVVQASARSEFGDFSVNLISVIGNKKNYKTLLDSILKFTEKKKEFFKKVEERNGFLNLFLNDYYLFGFLKDIITKGAGFGSGTQGNNKKVLVEFVSTNPTGPLNIVNARAAAVGDVIVRLLNFSGYKADAEFYINDAGRQIDMLGISAEKRFKEAQGEKVEIPEDGYKGEYIIDCIKKFVDDEKFKNMNEEQRVDFFKEYVKNEMLAWQKKSLERFGVKFKNWVSEREILNKFSVEEVVNFLRKQGDIYKKDGAVWFASRKYGDEKDRVLIKKDGTHTYIVSDASYHKNKFERGYEHLINIWGPDHHGYVKRTKAMVESFGFDPANLEIIIVQQVTLITKGEKKKMSKREGKFITLDEFLDSVNKDAVRFFFLMRKTSAHLDFDVELAKTLSLENPVYYTQYCYARTVNILNYAKEKGLNTDVTADLRLLKEPHEREITKLLLLFPEVVQNATEKREVHKLPYYLLSLSKTFHSYYQKFRIVSDDIPLSRARLFLIKAVKQVMDNGLNLIGVTAPERM